MEVSGVQGSEEEEGRSELPYGYDLLYGLKTEAQLQAEVEFLAHRLAGIASMRRDEGKSIDAYVLSVLAIPGAAVGGP